MGIFSFFKKQEPQKQPEQQEPVPTPQSEQKEKEHASAMEVIDEIDTEFAEKKAKPKTPTTTYESPWITTKHADGWEIDIRKDNGLPDIYTKDGKEWFDADNTWVSDSGEYFLHEGFDGKGNQGFALASKSAGLRIRKTDEAAEAAIVTDEGVAYVITDEGNLFNLTAEKASQKKLCEDYEPNACLLTPELCVVIYDADGDGEFEAVYVKAVNLKTARSWKKEIKYSLPNNNKLFYKVDVSRDIIEITMPDQTIHRFTKDGKL